MGLLQTSCLRRFLVFGKRDALQIQRSDDWAQFRSLHGFKNIKYSFGLEKLPSSASKLDKKVRNSEFLNEAKAKIRKLDLVGMMEDNCKNLVHYAVVSSWEGISLQPLVLRKHGFMGY